MGRYEVNVRQIRLAVMSCIVCLLQCLHNIRVKVRSRENKPFRSDRLQPMWTMVDAEGWETCVKDLLSRIFDKGEKDRYSLENQILLLPKEKSVAQILSHLKLLCQLCHNIISGWKVWEEDIAFCLPSCHKEKSQFAVDVSEDDRLCVSWDDGILNEDFLLAVEIRLNDIRSEKRQSTCEEFLITHLAYLRILKGGREKASKAYPLGSPGFHPHTQTYMALTNAGEGHVLGTTRCSDWMKGVLVHVEYIERPNQVSDKIEAYRIPSTLDLARVRLHVGTSAPTTCYIGHTLMDPKDFDNDFMKVVNFTAAAASQAFSSGAAECKISMFRLSTSQALRFMRTLAARVPKSPHQVLSAAWSLTHPLMVNSHPRQPPQGDTWLTKPSDIALKAVEMTSLGGFQKVTWDGSSDTRPSRCIMQQLTREEALNLVHVAHECGLLTYFSAGFGLNEIPQAVVSGVDGIGIGNVLHFKDPYTGSLGPYKEEDIPKILSRRDEAAKGNLGQGAGVLARLDTMYYEGSISCEDNDRRLRLFNALKAREEFEVSALTDQLQTILALPTEDSKPFLRRAERLVTEKSPMLRQMTSYAEWDKLKKKLEVLIENDNEEGVMEEYESDLWVSMREEWENHKSQNADSVQSASFLLPLKVCAKGMSTSADL